ncbi:hypothetical protein NLX83_37875 [Allokutzneria sp. A3M-2-11 16]|uniref:hypothetical protein n=1 Tax=Allokutzneria sp. A3M-2-11 16 TaxID=2962043 RepID=UPI0020B8CEC3|nr:hypothetical protein [Allokutzneria sp. A3M-2-11 16]MCP3805052.1 hypothetical protein [Allokutzneria sp. A3M-2-11 16]
MWIEFDPGDDRVFGDAESSAMTRLLRGLVGRLRDESITDAERAAISWFFGKNGPRAVEDLLALRADLPSYRFSDDGPTSAELLDTMTPGKRLFAAYRRPASPDALPAETWVYLIEVAPGEDVAFLHSQHRAGNGLVEVFAADERLPTYHRAALDAARLLWPHRSGIEKRRPARRT